MNAEQNERMTRIGPGTPAGAVLRRYWQPAALVEELPQERPVKEVLLLGESLVLFRKPDGNYGLIGRHCPHRGADLCFGRLEAQGLRCVFHGWLFDQHGACLDTPAEPEGRKLHPHLRHTAYPCMARSGVVFAYLGPGEPPPLPAFDCFIAPDDFTFAFKGLWECNWLQAQEVGIDPAHASFLHRFLEDEDPGASYGKQFRGAAADAEVPLSSILRDYPRPQINVESTGYGLRLVTLRKLDEQSMHVRVTNGIFPNAICIPMSNEMTITQWHVPIDDENSYWYSIFTSFGARVDRALMRQQRLEMHELPSYASKRNRSNRYGYNVQEQASMTYTGMGFDINVHDQWAVESLGRIQDRTQEHLGRSDIGIVHNRRLLLQAIESVANGEAALPMLGMPPTQLTGPIALDEIAPLDGWQQAWVARDGRRREACEWWAAASSKPDPRISDTEAR
jgi:nitrite reductase/ring-hydroxylating ferredoxin subunit